MTETTDNTEERTALTQQISQLLAGQKDGDQAAILRQAMQLASLLTSDADDAPTDDSRVQYRIIYQDAEGNIAAHKTRLTPRIHVRNLFRILRRQISLDHLNHPCITVHYKDGRARTYQTHQRFPIVIHPGDVIRINATQTVRR